MYTQGGGSVCVWGGQFLTGNELKKAPCQQFCLCVQHLSTRLPPSPPSLPYLLCTATSMWCTHWMGSCMFSASGPRTQKLFLPEPPAHPMREVHWVPLQCMGGLHRKSLEAVVGWTKISPILFACPLRPINRMVLSSSVQSPSLTQVLLRSASMMAAMRPRVPSVAR